MSSDGWRGHAPPRHGYGGARASALLAIAAAAIAGCGAATAHRGGHRASSFARPRADPASPYRILGRPTVDYYAHPPGFPGPIFSVLLRTNRALPHTRTAGVRAYVRLGAVLGAQLNTQSHPACYGAQADPGAASFPRRRRDLVDHPRNGERITVEIIALDHPRTLAVTDARLSVDRKPPSATQYLADQGCNPHPRFHPAPGAVRLVNP